jgi:hypothetical protein
MLAVSYAAYFVIFVYLASRVLNLTYNHAAMSGFALRSTVRARPDAPVRVQHIRHPAQPRHADSVGDDPHGALSRFALMLLASDDPDTLEAEGQGDVSAVGAEIDHVFDMDIGL